ncbi:MAG: PRC-barrel domain-containing protein [Actinomycetota bacterium]
MRGTFQLYRAFEPVRHDHARCCTDEPEGLRTADDRRPALFRWARKFGPAVAVATTAFRTTVRRPVHAGPVVGSRVVDPSGEHLGSVQDLLIGVESKTTTIAIGTSGDRPAPVLFVPDHALRRSARPDEFVVDGRVLDRARAA